MDLKLSLLENATDSLHEAIIKYEEGQEGDAKAFKFCVLHTCHFLELILKYLASRSDSQAILKPTKTHPNRTMSVKEVIDLLNTQGIKLPNNFERESRWLRELRNNIEHYHFEMDLTRVESTIGRLIEDVMKISETHDLHLERYVGPEFMSLAQQHRVKLNAAIERIEKAKALAYLGCSPKDSLEIKFGIYNCDDCDNPTLVSSDGSVTGYLCEFCGGEESHEMEVTCANCKGCWPYGEMELWLMDHDESEMRCPMCTGAYAMSRDNS